VSTKLAITKFFRYSETVDTQGSPTSRKVPKLTGGFVEITSKILGMALNPKNSRRFQAFQKIAVIKFFRYSEVVDSQDSPTSRKVPKLTVNFWKIQLSSVAENLSLYLFGFSHLGL